MIFKNNYMYKWKDVWSTGDCVSVIQSALGYLFTRKTQGMFNMLHSG